jgi:hypothetical protein
MLMWGFMPIPAQAVPEQFFEMIGDFSWRRVIVVCHSYMIHQRLKLEPFVMGYYWLAS